MDFFGDQSKQLQETTNFLIFPEEILNGKLHFLYSVM